MPGPTLITQSLAPPTQGIQQSIIAPAVPDGFLHASTNMVPRFGQLVTRPGFKRTNSTLLNDRVLGGRTFTKADGTTRLTVAATPSKWYQMTGTSWTDLTPATQLTATADNPTRFVIFPTSGTNLLIGVNNTDTPKKWDGAAASFTDLLGSPPIARSLTVAANHVVLFNVVESGVRSPSRGRISDFNNPESYPAGLVFDLTDTNDIGIGVEALGRLGFIAYKDESVWQAFPQAGTVPFRFELMEIVPGPASPAAIVSLGQTQYYLGKDARVYKVTGLSVTPVTDPVEKNLQDNFRLTQRARAWGVYHRLNRMVFFFFPGPTSDSPDRGVSVKIDTGAIALHTFPFTLTAGWVGDDVAGVSYADITSFTYANIAGTYPTYASFGGQQIPIEFIGSGTGLVHRFRYGVDDDGTAIPMSWEFPLRSYAGTEFTQLLDGLSSSFEQMTGGPLVTVSAAASDALPEVDFTPTYTTLGTHDTSLTTLQKLPAMPTTISITGLFLGFKFAATSSTAIKYRGTLLTGWASERT